MPQATANTDVFCLHGAFNNNAGLFAPLAPEDSPEAVAGMHIVDQKGASCRLSLKQSSDYLFRARDAGSRKKAAGKAGKRAPLAA